MSSPLVLEGLPSGAAPHVRRRSLSYPLTIAVPRLRPITLLAGLTSAVVRSRPRQQSSPWLQPSLTVAVLALPGWRHQYTESSQDLKSACLGGLDG